MSDIGSLFMGLLWVAFVVFELAAVWKVYAKAGQPGWGAFVPVYNLYLLVKMAGRPGWWTLLFFVPVANFIVAILVSVEVAGNFGKSTLFGVGLALLPAIFYPILGFGSATYGLRSAA